MYVCVCVYVYVYVCSRVYRETPRASSGDARARETYNATTGVATIIGSIHYREATIKWNALPLSAVVAFYHPYSRARREIGSCSQGRIAEGGGGRIFLLRLTVYE